MTNFKKYSLFVLLTYLLFFSCKNAKQESVKIRIELQPKGMVWIPKGTFIQGAVLHDAMALPRELPNFKVKLDGFFMDITEVTNEQFAKFIDETGYITLAERPIDWDEMKKELPVGTLKPADSLLQPGSLTFKKVLGDNINLQDVSRWWKWTLGANWKHPLGPESTIKGKEKYPVTHIAYEDALAYCKWANRRLPTEAEWEYAARGNQKEAIYFWGNDVSVLSTKANTWNGNFPTKNTEDDGYERSAPVKKYPPNPFGLHDMAGNVWEWTSDWYNEERNYELAASNKIIENPKASFSKLRNPNIQEKVIKGGSFLCNDSYCSSYRISSKMNSSINSSAEHIGFRTVATIDMLKNKKE